MKCKLDIMASKDEIICVELDPPDPVPEGEWVQYFHCYMSAIEFLLLQKYPEEVVRKLMKGSGRDTKLVMDQY